MLKQNGSKLFFASDFHLGYDDSNNEREHRIASWIKTIPNNSELFLVGDIFDFWIEYKNSLPTKNIYFFETLDSALKRGIKIYMFKGNHDMWISDFFKEKGINIIDNELIINRDGCTFYIHHGDGILKGEFWYNILKKILRNSVTQKLAKKINSKILLTITYKWSHYGHIKKQLSQCIPKNKIINFANLMLKRTNINFFILGHYHHKELICLNNNTHIVLLGDWIKDSSYGVFDKGRFKLY